jgi:hypothetical protein
MKKYNNTGNAGVHKNKNRSGHASGIRAGNGSDNPLPLQTAI